MIREVLWLGRSKFKCIRQVLPNLPVEGIVARQRTREWAISEQERKRERQGF